MDFDPKKERIPDKYTVDIDFDNAEKLWRMNKIKENRTPFGDHGSFEYVCGHIKANGEPCHSPPYHWKNKRNDGFVKTWGPCKKHLK